MDWPHRSAIGAITHAAKYRWLFLAVMAAGIATAVAVLVTRSKPGHAYYFMPGPLGRMEVPLGGQRNAETLKSGNAEIIRHEDSGSDLSVSTFADVAHRSVQRFSVLRPGYLTRAIGLRAGAETEWGEHNGITARLSFSHNLAQVFPRELYATHPEFFPLADGKRLDLPPGYTYWNPDLGREDVARHAADEAKTYFAAHPAADSFSLGVNDALVFGESTETLQLVTPQRWFRGRPDYSRLVFTFMNRAAADLAKSYPDKYLGCLAYYWCENTPGFPVDPHVIPFLTADRAQSYDPAFVKQEFDLQQRWAEALGATGFKPKALSIQPGSAQEEAEVAENGRSHQAGTDANGEPSTVNREPAHLASVSQPSTPNSQLAEPRPRLGLYDYLDDWGFLVPRVPIHAFAEHIRHAHEVGFTDYYGESERNWGLDGPMPWVITQLLQDPEQNVDRLLDIYYQNYFGPAAQPMRAFFDRCEQQWMHQAGPSYWLKHYRNESQATLFPPDVCAELRALLRDAAAAAQGGGSAGPLNGGSEADQRIHGSTDPQPASIFARRVAFVSDSFGVTERFVAFQYARDALSRATLDGTVTTSQLQSYLDARSEFIRYSVAVTHRWPLAFYPIAYDDWLKNDPSFAASFTLARRETLSRARSDISQSGNADTLKSESAAAQHVPRADASNFSISALQLFRFSSVAAGVAAAAAGADGHGREILPNGSLEGPLLPGRKIAGLPYGINLPAPWTSKVEPMEHHLGVVWRPAARTGTQGLRISGAENDDVFQWLPVTGAALYSGSVALRGHVSPSCEVTLTLGWLDAQGRRLGAVQVMRLPDGDWRQWVTLRQGGRPPTTTAWIGIGIRVQHQSPGDWIEADDFSLRAAQ